MKLTVKELLDLMPSYQLFDVREHLHQLKAEDSDLTREDAIKKFGDRTVMAVKSDFSQEGYDLEDETFAMDFEPTQHTAIQLTITLSSCKFSKL